MPRSKKSADPAMAGAVRLRLPHDNAPPIHDTGEPYLLGLQTAKGEIVPGRALADGRVAFDFELQVKAGADRPVFLGPFAAGTVTDRFVYLSWKAAERPGYINRVKARLSSITWDQVREAQSQERILVADMTGRGPHDASPVAWRLA